MYKKQKNTYPSRTRFHGSHGNRQQCDHITLKATLERLDPHILLRIRAPLRRCRGVNISSGCGSGSGVGGGGSTGDMRQHWNRRHVVQTNTFKSPNKLVGDFYVVTFLWCYHVSVYLDSPASFQTERQSRRAVRILVTQRKQKVLRWYWFEMKWYRVVLIWNEVVLIWNSSIYIYIPI